MSMVFPRDSRALGANSIDLVRFICSLIEEVRNSASDSADSPSLTDILDHYEKFLMTEKTSELFQPMFQILHAKSFPSTRSARGS
jgi:hypothetical protein